MNGLLLLFLASASSAEGDDWFCTHASLSASASVFSWGNSTTDGVSRGHLTGSDIHIVWLCSFSW